MDSNLKPLNVRTNSFVKSTPRQDSFFTVCSQPIIGSYIMASW